jgi:hypothetical protein
VPLEQPKKNKTEIENVSEFLDAYFERCAKPAGLRSVGSVRSQIGVLKENLPAARQRRLPIGKDHYSGESSPLALAARPTFLAAWRHRVGSS